MIGRSVEVLPHGQYSCTCHWKTSFPVALFGMRTPFAQSASEVESDTPVKKKREPQGLSFLFWSKCGDSNSRPPVPEASQSSLLTTFVYFLVLFSPKAMLSDALVRTVSTQSESVDGQRCGHRANFAILKARKLNRIYPVLSFIFVVSIAYFRKLVNTPL